MKLFHVEITLRYTRISCLPMGARLGLTRLVQALDPTDAERQTCLCIDRDLQQIMASVNAINVSDVQVEIRHLSEVTQEALAQELLKAAEATASNDEVEVPVSIPAGPGHVWTRPPPLWNPTPFPPDLSVPKHIVIRPRRTTTGSRGVV